MVQEPAMDEVGPHHVPQGAKGVCKHHCPGTEERAVGPQQGEAAWASLRARGKILTPAHVGAGQQEGLCHEDTAAQHHGASFPEGKRSSPCGAEEG